MKAPERVGSGSAAVLAAVLACAAGPAAAAPAGPGIFGLWAQPDTQAFSNPRNAAERAAARPFSGLTIQPHPPVFTPEYGAIYKARVDAQRAGRPIADATANCAPPGVPRMMYAPYPIQIVEAPDMVLVLAEYFMQVRRIYTDGRGHPKEVEKTFNGDSVGHWEGDTLVVDTVGLVAETMIDVTLLPHSDQLHVVERMRRNGADLEIQTTLEDPIAWVGPWSTTKTYNPLEGDILEYVCAENNRNFQDEQGVTVIQETSSRTLGAGQGTQP